MKKVYVLMVDFEGKMDTRPKPIGVCLESEQDAMDFADAPFGHYGHFLGFDRSYEEVEVYSDLKDAEVYSDLKDADNCLKDMEARVLND